MDRRDILDTDIEKLHINVSCEAAGDLIVMFRDKANEHLTEAQKYALDALTGFSSLRPALEEKAQRSLDYQSSGKVHARSLLKNLHTSLTIRLQSVMLSLR